MRKVFVKVLVAALITLWVHAFAYTEVMNCFTADDEKGYSGDSFETCMIFIFYGILLLYLFPVGTFPGLVNHFKVENKVYSIALSVACFSGYGTLLFLLSPDPKGYLVNITSWLVAGLAYGTIYVLWLSRYLKFWQV